MRPLIPPLRSGPRGFSVLLGILAPPLAHNLSIPIQLGVFRPLFTGPAPLVRNLKPFPGFSTLKHISQLASTQQRQLLSTSQILRSKDTEKSQPPKNEILQSEVEAEGFGRSEKASRAAQVNLSARLNKDGSPNPTKPGMGEIVRLLRIARPEAKWLGGRNLGDGNFV